MTSIDRNGITTRTVSNRNLAKAASLPGGRLQPHRS
jgi:hypothetical protein